MFTNHQIERFSRQLILKGFGTKAQNLLAKSKILVIGAGGFGSPALHYLTGAGVGTIGIAEFDKVDLSNLHRQILFTQSDVGARRLILLIHICKKLILTRYLSCTEIKFLL
jgi:sulfur-carrier protein adenylyltransferase/sulfurtransferase